MNSTRTHSVSNSTRRRFWRTLALAGGMTLLACRTGAQSVEVDANYPVGGGPVSYVQTVALDFAGRALISGVFTNVSGIAITNLARINTNGIVDATFAPQPNSDPAQIQSLPDGRIMIAGNFVKVNGDARPGIARLLEDGSTDTNFVPAPFQPFRGAAPVSSAMAESDGSVYVAGTFTNVGGLSRNWIARLLPDGSVDEDFHSPFPVPTQNELASGLPVATLVAVEPDGKPLLSGSFSNLAGLNPTTLIRLNTDGSLDASYHSGLPADAQIFRCALDNQDRLVAAVRTMNSPYQIATGAQRLVRLNADGSLDSSFQVPLEGPTNLLTSTIIYSIVVQSDGRILIGGTFLRVDGTPRAHVARLEPDGALDYCYDLQIAGEILPLAMAAASDGSVIVGGSFGPLQGKPTRNLARLLPSPGCAPGVIEMGVPQILAREDESEVVVPVVRHGGADLDQSVEFATVDGSAKGGVDFRPTVGSIHFAPGERSQSIHIPLLHSGPEIPKTFQVVLNQAGGGAILGSLTNTIVTVMNPPAGTAGLPDTNYIVHLDAPVQFILPEEDGSAIIVGGFTNVDGQPCPNVARLNADGSRDTGFNRSQPLEGTIEAAALDSHGRVLIAGWFQYVDGLWRPGLARFKTDGSLDPGFAPFDSVPTNSYAVPEVLSLAVLPDDSILCTVSPPLDNSSSAYVLVKISPDGIVDTDFTTNGLPARAFALLPQANGRVLFAGGGLGNPLLRLEPDGSIDRSFIPTEDLSWANALQVGSLQDGRIVVDTSPYYYLWGLGILPRLVRLNPDGSLDSGFTTAQSYPELGSLGGVDAFQVSPDQRILLAGRFSNATDSIPALVRLRADGSLDLSFDEGAGLAPRQTNDLYAQMNAIAPLPGGGWLIGGEFGGYDGFQQPNLVKVLPETPGRPRTIQFAASDLTVPETNGPITLEVQRRGDASGPASVQISTADGTARAGEDYEPVNMLLNFAPGEWTKTVTINLLDDYLVDGYQQFTVQLSNPSGGYSLGNPATVAITVQNNDAAVNFISNEFHAVEEDGYALIGVTWSGAVSNLQTKVGIFPITGDSGDLGISSITLTHQGATNWFRIPIRDNSIHEPTREFRLTLTGGPNLYAGPAATLFLDDRDYPTTPARGVAGIVETMASSPGGGVYIAGDFNGVSGAPIHNVARLTPDGEVDFNFFPGAGPNGDVTAIAAQPGAGKVLIAGNFSAVDGVPRAGLARLGNDGSLDATFDPGVGAQGTNGSSEIRFILPQSDGSVYVGGTFTRFNARPADLMVKLDSSGAVDPSFASPFIPMPKPWIIPRPQPIGPLNASEISAAVQQSNGEIVVAKYAPNLGFVLGSRARAVPIYPWPIPVPSSAWSLIRLGLSGQPDGRFGSNELANVGYPVNSLAISQIGDIFAGVSRVYTTGAWPGVVGFDLSGKPLSYFKVRGAPPIEAYLTDVQNLVIQEDRKIIFSAAIYTTNDPAGPGERLNRVIIGRLKYDGQWDDSFPMLTCDQPLIHEAGPFWFDFPTNSLAALLGPIPTPEIPTVSLARQLDGVLVLAGAFDSVNGEPRHRLARINPDGTIRGRMDMRLMPGDPMQLMLPAEVEAPYKIETSKDLQHWADWLRNDYPWWGANLSLAPSEPTRYFRISPVY